MTAEPLKDAGENDPMQEAFRLLGENDAATAAEDARLDREDELDRQAAHAEAQSNAAVIDFATRMEIQNVVDAAALAREGYDPGWDWRSQADELGIDEYGKPLGAEQAHDADEGKAAAPADQSPPATTGARAPSAW